MIKRLDPNHPTMTVTARLFAALKKLGWVIITYSISEPKLCRFWFSILPINSAFWKTLLNALERTESAGGHFREESQTPEGEALRNDEDFAFTSAWEYIGEPSEAILHKENLEFNDIELKQRSYK